MKITDVEIIVVDIPEPGMMDKSPVKPGALPLKSSIRHQSVGSEISEAPHCTPPQIVVLVVKTDSKLEGYGFGWGTKGGMRLAHTIAEVFRPKLIGNDPLDRERLWHAAHRARL